MVLVLARIIGIKPISHYRTDVFFYVDQLIDNAMARWFVKTWVKTFCAFSRPIIVPSNDFKDILPKEMNMPKEEFVRIDRGIHLEQFNPSKKKSIWPQSSEEVNTRFLFVGRISQEKEIDFLVECFNQYVDDGGLGELIFVGQGPYLEELKTISNDQKRIKCVGKKMGDDLAAFYAEADYFLFPSGSDTFGNVVVEALASGTPAFVSDRGGPKDIVAAEKTGMIIPFKDKEKWVKAFVDAQKNKQTNEYAEWEKASEKHSQSFSLERSANHFWNFYKKVLEKNAKQN
jgi:glycosyltransferase involved in cell wall biosynthesis